MRRPLAAGVLLVSLIAGVAVSARTTSVAAEDSGVVTLQASIVSDPVPGRRGWEFVVDPLPGGGAGIERTRLGVSAEWDPAVEVGATVELQGRLSARRARLHRSPIGGWVVARSVVSIADPRGPISVANAVRARVHGEFPASTESGALMRGFLIGDTSGVSPTLLEEMRRAGLLHFVAVSGGNVAVFLAAVWLAAGAVPLGPRMRATLGLGSLLVFVLVTRWEPSVVRAGLMMGLLLAGRVGGVPIDGWVALGGAVAVLATVAPQLVFDVGFQLSVLATAGLLVGSHLWLDRRPRWFWASLGATLAAQVAVLPLLLTVFGAVPAFAAVANVGAAPLVAVATALGWAATFTGFEWVGQAARLAAAGVIELSGWAAALPQVGVGGLVGMLGILVLLRRWPSLGISIAVGALVLVSLPAPPPAVATVTFLDVGQGDATLLRSPTGEVVAVDTGPDAVSYAAALRRHGISRLDLLVLTHSDGDHVGGLEAVLDRIDIAEVWHPQFTPTDDWQRLLAGIEATVEPVRRGDSRTIGSFRLEVQSPARRYAADNDGSVVLWVVAPGGTVLLAGDVEAVAQAELPGLRPDVLLVPHHGSKTTDPTWLARTLGPIAVLSFGDNSFGHPAPEIVEILETSGTVLHTTDRGDVMLPLAQGSQAGRAGPVRANPLHVATDRHPPWPRYGRTSSPARLSCRSPGRRRWLPPRMPPRSRTCTSARCGMSAGRPPLRRRPGSPRDWKPNGAR